MNDGEGGLFEFWLRFGSVTGFIKPAPSPKPRQNSKILAPNGYNFFSNALVRKKRQARPVPAESAAIGEICEQNARFFARLCV
jgi:hypothetical protein